MKRKAEEAAALEAKKMKMEGNNNLNFHYLFNFKINRFHNIFYTNNQSIQPYMVVDFFKNFYIKVKFSSYVFDLKTNLNTL